MLQSPINPKRAYYIKLGRNGAWEEECLKEKQILRLGYQQISDDLCRQGKWDEVRSILFGIRNDIGTAKRDENQIRYFYEADNKTLWTTFFGDRLYWCFSEPQITQLPDKTKTRPVIGEWSSMDIYGKPLKKIQLSGSLLSMEGFRGTICRVKELNYLTRKINGIVQPEVEEALLAKAELESKTAAVIQKLTWKDFELLIDLIFRQAGWQRMSILGKTGKSIDLDLLHPLTDERFVIQVKSSAKLAQLEHFREKLTEYQDYDRAYFIVHSPKGRLAQARGIDDIEVWLPDDIAHLVVIYGLTDWVINKAT